MSAAASCFLEAQGVGVDIQGRSIVKNASCSLHAGQISAIIGPNGAGKSTLLRCLAGLQAHSGSVQLQGWHLRQMPARERARRISYLAQHDGGSALDDLAAQDIVLLGRLPHQGLLASAQAADAQAVEAAMQAANCSHLRLRLFGQLSGGERQKVLLARALAVQAQALLMDEPLNHLDPPHQADWLLTVRALVAGGTTVVSVLHELTFALHADDVVVMADGRIAHHGACAERTSHRALERVFDQRIAIHAVQGQWVALPAWA